MTRPWTVALIIPTGIGAALGGYAGDALPIARACSAVADWVISHPNVLNGASLYWPQANVLYVEGYALNQLAAGRWGLEPVTRNRIGLILDQGIESDLQLRHRQVALAAQATLGLEVVGYGVTDEPLDVHLQTATSGATWGTIGRPDSLLRAAERLIQDAQAEALAVVARFPDEADSPALQDYRAGHGVDPLAGAEAVISHLVVRTLGVPCAHAPALQPLPLSESVHPRALAEELGYTFLPCVLAGLSRAPRYVPLPQARAARGSLITQVDAVIVPETACGGEAVLHWGGQGVPVIAVRDNATRMQVRPADVGLQALSVGSYLEAVGVLAALKAGVAAGRLTSQAIDLPQFSTGG
ncbi:MAG: DUF3326 domain-containing protein [Gloeomargaritaceae cyanobacterium C42_A2020_066]|nr:DUF3326 domain-containing protein [Gloeomargaritaceae cyanobacterium C42_A2020_066]